MDELLASAEEVDDSQFYDYDDLIEPYAGEGSDLFGLEFSSGAWGGYLDGIEYSKMTFSQFLPKFRKSLLNIEEAIEAASLDLSWVGYGPTSWGTLFDYLDRYRLDNQLVQGSLSGISSYLEKAIGWTAGKATVLGLLGSIDNRAYSILEELVYVSLALPQYFLDVTSRQDSFAEWNSNLWSKDSWIGYWYKKDTGRLGPNTVSGFQNFLQQHQGFMANAMVIDSGSYLGAGGAVTSTGNKMMYFAHFVRYGFLGLSANLAGSDKTASISSLVPSSDGGLKVQQLSATNILDMLGLIGTQLQNPLAKLAYVWADDDDIRIADKNQPVKDEIEDNFVGDGSGAVKPSDIGDIAGIAGDFKNTFSGLGSVWDVFGALNDSSSYWFFSQKVADALDQVNAPAVVAQDDSAQDYLADFWVDEEGYYHPKSSAFWDVSSYLEGLE